MARKMLRTYRRGKTGTSITSTPKLQKIPTKALTDALNRLWRHSTQAFVRTLVANMEVDTGQSVASIYSLAAQVSLGSEILSDIMGSGKRKGFTDIRGTYHPSGYRSVNKGKTLGAQARASRKHLVQFSTPGMMKMKLRFEIASYQHARWEHEWKSIEKARKAFRDYWSANIFKYVPRKTILKYIGGH